MKIGLIAPSPVPFTVGGAEKFYWGLQEHINKNTAHQCELVKIPVKENNFWNLIDSYYKFYRFDVSHFDAVITSKYPAWMVSHDNHHIYMLHCLRGLYDLYPPAFPVDFNLKHKGVKEILKYMDGGGSNAGFLFDMLYGLKKDTSVPDDTYAFPGPFIKKIIGFLDKKAMQKVKSFSAISKTVAARKEYFPDFTAVKVIYPPSNLENFKSGRYEYFFTVSRLDEAKRIRLVIEAYMKLKTGLDVPLKIAGIGPLEEELKETAKNDPGIEFLGFVSDKELIDYYANALAVIFVPYEEDYGLVTLEAMMSGKPVITLEDSGGVKEFVKDGETGFVCSPSAGSLSGAMEKIAEDKGLAEQMGMKAKKEVENITWENAFNSLTLNFFENFSVSKKSRKKITVAVTYPVYPPRGGGQNRIFYLYKELANYFDIEIITLTGENDTASRKEIAPNLIETRVPKSKEYAKKEFQIQQKIGIFATDIAMLYFYGDAGGYSEAVKRASAVSDCLISSHPYSYPVLKKYGKYNKSILIYESHNVESELKKQMMFKNAESDKIWKNLFDAEKEACLDSDYTVVCALDDAHTMQKIYGLDLSRVIETPNGVDLETVKFFSPQERKELKNKLGLGEEKIVLFIASWHKPNIDAAEKIIAAAEKIKNYKFIILGGIGDYFKSNKISCPSNVGFTGIVSDEEKNFYLSAADLAVNPMAGGSGTNLKMLDYMAAGVPVLSTAIGARGLKLEKTPNTVFDSDFIETADIENFSDAVSACLKNFGADKIYKARKHAELNFDWKIIAENFKNRLAEII